MFYVKKMQTFTVLAILMASGNLCYAGTAADSWIMFAREARTVFKSCPGNVKHIYDVN